MTITERAVDIEHAEAIYTERLRGLLEPGQDGKAVAIHPASGDYVVAETRGDAMRAMLERHPEGGMLIRRIGPPTPEDIRTAARLYAEQLLVS